MRKERIRLANAGATDATCFLFFYFFIFFFFFHFLLYCSDANLAPKDDNPYSILDRSMSAGESSTED